MKTMALQQRNIEPIQDNDGKTKKNKINETRAYEILSRYFIWFMNNNIEEFQMFSKFWSRAFLNHTSLFDHPRKLN